MMIRSRRGVTLPELIVSMVVIVLTAGVTFNAYTQARMFANRFKYKAMAASSGAAVLDNLRYSYAYDSVTNPGNLTVNDTDADGVPDDSDSDGNIDEHYYTVANTAAWPLSSVASSVAAKYTVANVWFGNDGQEYNQDQYADQVTAGNIPAARPAFKKIILKVEWTRA